MRFIFTLLLAGAFFMADEATFKDNIKANIEAFKARRAAAELTQEGRTFEAVAPRGITPEQAAIRDSIKAFKARRRGKGLGRVGGVNPNAESMGVYPDTGTANDRVLGNAPNYRPQREVARPVFQDEKAFKAVELEAAQGFKPLKSTVRSRGLGVGHWAPPKKAAPYLEKIREVEEAHGMPANMMAALIHTESSFNPKAKSHRGAKGLTQIMPNYHPTVKDPYDPDEAITYGADYLSKLKKQFGSWELALAAYNWGPGNLRKHGIKKAPKETRDYIKKILGKVHVED